MSQPDNAALLKQIDAVEAFFDEVRRAARYEDLSGTPAEIVTKFTMSCLTTIERIVGRSHTYYAEACRLITDTRFGGADNHNVVLPLLGLIRSLRSDIDNGFLRSMQELIHAELFSDFLEMADYLLAEGYKDPAAVLLSGVLETHTRKLANLHSIAVVDDRNGTPVPRRTEQLNQDLHKALVYNLLTQKTVTAWLDLRNKAAHAKYSEYTKENVELFSQWLRDFVLKYPA